MLARTAPSDSLVDNKMVARMATIRRRWTTNRTALSAVTTGVSVLSGIRTGWSSLPDCPMPLVAGELNNN